jgi:hypothetical protein
MFAHGRAASGLKALIILEGLVDFMASGYMASDYMASG